MAKKVFSNKEKEKKRRLSKLCTKQG